ncbi:MAG TPA: hypothetical protein VJ654_17935 [Noviherbaspirillum sp.]|nr:hypothetical protein [Noviherbaspirillum sp.]
MKRTRAANAASPDFAAAKSHCQPGIDAKRRRTVVAAALACAIPSLAFAAATPSSNASAVGIQDASVAMAITFLQDRYCVKLPVVYSPVSLL